MGVALPKCVGNLLFLAFREQRCFIAPVFEHPPILWPWSVLARCDPASRRHPARGALRSTSAPRRKPLTQRRTGRVGVRRRACSARCSRGRRRSRC
jgi:hypothetical protein